MAATATEQWKQNTLSKRPDNWRATRSFFVDQTTSETAALAVSGIPVINDAHPNNSNLLCDDVTARPEGPDVFIITATYSIPTDGNAHAGTGVDSDPLLTPPLFRWQTVSETAQVESDRDGYPIVNSARMPFDSLQSRRFNFKQLSITRNEPYYDVFGTFSYENTVNAADWNIPGSGVIYAGNALCVSIQPTHAYAELATHVNIEYMFWCRAGGWGTRSLDQGFHTLALGATRPREIMDATGRTKVTSPVMLDGTGRTFLGATGTGYGTPSWATLDTTAYGAFLTYYHYAEADFDALYLF